MLNVAILTSEVHYVPENYLVFLTKLLELQGKFNISHIYVLKNWNVSLIVKSLTVALVAPRLGGQLLWNGFSNARVKRLKLCQEAGCPITLIESTSKAQFRDQLLANKIDLLINARSRAIFGPKLLATPPLGCLNIHHGLLPLQRGTFCDFHALRRHENPGFTIHKMTKILDGGEILAQESLPFQKDYLGYIHKSSALEAKTLAGLLDSIADQGKLPAAIKPNIGNSTYYKTPSLLELIFMPRNGVKI